MKENYTHISIVLDRSGSMSSTRDDTIGGFNTFLEEQKQAEGTATLTLVQFDHEYDYIYQMKDIRGCEILTDKTYVPRGSTALLDAMGRTVNETGAALSALPQSERPEQVILVIITDGYENASREFTKVKINEMIEHQKDKYDWQVIYLGANQDAIAEGGGYGVAKDMSMTFANNAAGTAKLYKSLSTNTTRFRSKMKTDMAFEAEDREDQEEELKGAA